MRIVGGRLKGRTLTAPAGPGVRPTSDRARESLFNVLSHGTGVEFDGITVVDVFAGSGALGLEAMSRGATHGVFIDSDERALSSVRRNAGPMGLGRDVTVLRLDATRLPPPPRAAKVPAALAFLDPPYNSGLVPPALLGLAAKGWLAADAVVVAEVAAKEPLDAPKDYEILDERTWGAARMVILGRA